MATARYLMIREWKALRPDFRDLKKIFRKRRTIERSLARQARAAGHDGEYSLDEVLRRLLKAVLLQGGEDEAKVHDLVQFEIRHERRHSYADTGIREFIGNYPAARTEFLTDFYMPAPVVLDLLERHGFGDVVQGGISSCDVKLNKRSGRLFKYVHRHFGLSPDQHIHIGDNEQSDVTRSRENGVRAVRYFPPGEGEDQARKNFFFKHRKRLFAYIQGELSAGKGQVPDLDGTARSAYQLGLKSAPLFVGYALFILEFVLREGHDSLYFFTREGEFFIQLYEILAEEARKEGYDCPKGRLLEVSRIATFCASLRTVSTAEMMRLWSLYRTQSLFALAKTLCVDPTQLEPIARRYEIEMDEKIARPWESVRIQRLFADTEFQRLVESHRVQGRTDVLAYLSQYGLTDMSKRVCVVDIGWRGTIQDNLALLLPSVKFTGLYLGLQQFLNEQPRNTEKHAYGPDLNRAFAHASLLDAITPIEMVTNSPCGSVLGYRKDAEGRVVARRMVDDSENAAYFAFTQHFQAGVLSAARSWSHFVEAYSITSAELRQNACQVWGDLVARAPRELARVYGNLQHNEIYGVGGFVDKRVVPTPKHLVKAIFDTECRQNVILYIRQTQWPAGLWARDDIPLFHKYILASALFAARAYKRLLILYRSLAKSHRM